MPERLTNKAIKEMLEKLAIDRNVAYRYIAPLVAEINACWTDRMQAKPSDDHDKAAEIAVAYEAARVRYEQAEKERDEARFIADKKHEAIELMTAERDQYRRDYEAELSGNGELRAKYGAEDREGFSAFVARVAQEREDARTAMHRIQLEADALHDLLDRESVPTAQSPGGEFTLIQRVEMALKSRGEFALATRAELINLGKVQAQLVERVRELEKELGQERLVTADLRKQREARHRDIELILTEVERLRGNYADAPLVMTAKEG